MRPYQIMFGGRMPFMDASNWLTVMERQSAKPQIEDGFEDDKDSLNLQARFERTNNPEYSVGIQTASLPGHRLRRTLALKSFTPGLPSHDFQDIADLYTPSRTIPPPDFSAPPAPSASPMTSGSAPPAEPGPSTRTIAASLASSALQEADRQLAVRLQKELDRQIDDKTANHSGDFSSYGHHTDGSFAGFEDDEEAGGTHAPRFGDIETPESSLSSLSSEAELEHGLSDENDYSKNLGLTNRPPGAPKDWGIDVTSLKARHRQASHRAKVAARYDKGHNVEVFKVGSIVSVKIPPKDRPTGVVNRRLFARILKMKNEKKHLSTSNSSWYSSKIIPYSRPCFPAATLG